MFSRDQAHVRAFSYEGSMQVIVYDNESGS
jgi:hypothetical protein